MKQTPFFFAFFFTF
ncbi:pheA operon leader peptide PheL, partial [Enterobacter hormaechei]